MSGTIVITGLILLGNIFLLVWDYKKLFILVSPENKDDFVVQSQYNQNYNHKFWAYLGLLMFATTVIYVLIHDRNPLGWFLICVAEGIVGLLFFNFKLKKQLTKSNNQ